MKINSPRSTASHQCNLLAGWCLEGETIQDGAVSCVPKLDVFKLHGCSFRGQQEGRGIRLVLRWMGEESSGSIVSLSHTHHTQVHPLSSPSHSLHTSCPPLPPLSLTHSPFPLPSPLLYFIFLHVPHSSLPSLPLLSCPYPFLPHPPPLHNLPLNYSRGASLTCVTEGVPRVFLNTLKNERLGHSEPKMFCRHGF